MVLRALLLVAVTATLAVPATAQAVPRMDTPMTDVDPPRLDFSPSVASRAFLAPPRPVVVPIPPTAPAADSRTRLRDELRAYQRQRTIGSGVLVAGATALVAALFDWGNGDSVGMSTGATAALMGGTGLMFLGAEFRRVATQRIARAEERRDRAAATGSGNR